MSDLAQRPRLADFALARRHTARGETFVVIHDTRDGSLVRLTLREWAIVACADGTRDLDGIILAAARTGAYRRASEVRALFAALHASGLIEGGTDSPVAAAALLPDVPADRPLDPLPGYLFACDGSGGCCGHYGSIELLPADALRARVHVPVVDGGFTPLRGSRDGGSLAAALVDGRCAYLADDGRCRIHAAAGAGAKPVACHAYPRTYVDDGEAVRVSVGIECACVLASLDANGGEPLIPRGDPTRGALPGGTKVRALPALVAITERTATRREDIAAWSRAALARMTDEDAAVTLWRLAEDLEGARRVQAPSASDLRPWVSRIAENARGAAEAADAWRSDGDAARRARHRVADGAERWLGRRAWLAAAWPRDEELYARATIHGHHCAGEVPFASALRERAARLLVARDMGERFAIADVEHILRA